MRFGKRWAVLCVAVLMPAGQAAWGLINPDFTPIQLVEQAGETIAVLKVRNGADGQLVGTVTRVFRSKGDKLKVGDTVNIDLKATVASDHARDVKKDVAEQPDMQAMLFVGEFTGALVEQGNKREDAWLHLGRYWVGLFKTNAGWEMNKIDTNMEGTWAGSTEMLVRCIEYVMSDSSADVPINTEEISWDEQADLGKLAGGVNSAAAVRLDGKGADALFVAADEGDRLYLFGDDAMKDATVARKLASKSKSAAWGDFNHDGRVDLASWDGKRLSVYGQAGDGTFAAAVPVDVGDAIKGGVVGLAVVDVGGGQAGLVAGTPTWPVVLAPKAGKWTATPLGAGELPKKDLTNAGPCVVADLDGDRIADVLQLFENGGLVYKGKAVGQFDKAEPIDMSRGKGASVPFVGDFDADGLLDVFCAADDHCWLWHNRGNFKFVQSREVSGEINYIAKANSGAFTGGVCDVNNDGRQDVLIVYSSMAPQHFFNRGFRSFGHSRDLDLGEKSLLVEEGAEEGLQAGCMGDFNGDGAQDFAVVLKKAGGVHVLFRNVPQGRTSALAVRVSLPVGSVVAGPVTVVGYDGDRCLGAWNVVAGAADAFIARRDDGKLKIKWQLPGGKEQEKEFRLSDEPVNFVLTD